MQELCKINSHLPEPLVLFSASLESVRDYASDVSSHSNSAGCCNGLTWLGESLQQQ